MFYEKPGSQEIMNISMNSSGKFSPTQFIFKHETISTLIRNTFKAVNIIYSLLLHTGIGQNDYSITWGRGMLK